VPSAPIEQQQIIDTIRALQPGITADSAVFSSPVERLKFVLAVCEELKDMSWLTRSAVYRVLRMIDQGLLETNVD